MSGLSYIKNVVTLQLDQQKCNSCLMCITVCPHEVFQYKEKKVSVANKDYCMECGACAKNCSQKAIIVKTGVGCATGIINGLLRGTEANCDCTDSESKCC